MIFALRPWQAATFTSHDEGSFFREDAGDTGYVKLLGNDISYSVHRLASIIEVMEDSLLTLQSKKTPCEFRSIRN